MKQKISEKLQSIIIYKINPNGEELNGEVDTERNVHGRILTGNFFVCDQILIVEDNNNKVTGIFSLNNFYFIESDNT